jgi:predicted nuclease of predicted toxin-antitoxin system
LVKKLEQKFPGTVHVSKAGLLNKTDIEIWEYARKENFIIVTFDSDFYDFSLTKGQPPKLIWIRSGNTTTNNIDRLLNEKADQISTFVNDPIIGCLEIDD